MSVRGRKQGRGMGEHKGKRGKRKGDEGKNIGGAVGHGRRSGQG